MRFLILIAVVSMLFLSPAQAQDKGRDAIAEEKGVASFYSWRHQGRRMANGKRFNTLGAPAASRTLPLGSRVRVTNLANGESTDVTVGIVGRTSVAGLWIYLSAPPGASG